MTVTDSVTMGGILFKGIRINMIFEKLEKEKQNKIINAASEVFAKYGYKKASMKDIAEAAGISKSVLFKYVSNKEKLYLKIFRLASDSIIEADEISYAEEGSDSDMFALMRRNAKTRLSLFKEYPWIYKFSYTAAFDNDCFVKELVRMELENYRKPQLNTREIQLGNKITTDGIDVYKGLRADISPTIAKQLILWVSQGYLEEKLFTDKIDPDGLEKGFEEWIDILEILLKGSNRSCD
ncbi:TetR family transcriptional regulator [Acetobacterium paludosum]|uniref:TetR family transcriptional regulator n=1 Tax=Acetobacterium paludosum TaxID=52693 RepID=A0A923HZH9_9FIRM|nr:TetR/AcrR family transcriptional regulator [Acetobacterium paludosum]MBC3889975.1 TetR family transcriptional regulator [Acetobacterium paludosum]